MQPFPRARRSTTRAGTGLVAALWLVVASTVSAQEVQLDWQLGPGTQPLGVDLAEIDVPSDYVSLDTSNTKKLMELMENPITGTEVGTVAPASDAEAWFIVFEYDAVGYVKDDEAGSLDPDAILKSIREGTEAANEERRRRGWATMDIVGWHEEPHYDPLTQNLTWAIIGKSEHGTTINKITKLLGRHGVVTATLVSSPEELATASPRTDMLIADFRYRPGSTYAEFIPGKDKIAKFGLAALVVGGAGAALVSSGVLARFWKVIVAGVVGLIAGVKRLFGSRRAEEEPITTV